VAGHDVEQVGEHGGVGRETGGDVSGEEAAEGTPQLVFVEVVGSFDDLEERVGERRWVAAVDGQQQPLERGAHRGVDAADRAEVEQRELIVAEQKAQPGGWGRARWWDVRMGRPGYQPVALEYSDLIEFGADLPVGTGRHATWFPVRWYGILLSTSRWELVAHRPHRTPEAAQRVAQDLRSSLAYRLIGQIELAPPPSARPAPRRQLYLQEPAYRPPAP